MNLTIKNLSADLSGKTNKLTVTNQEGTTEYLFMLELGAKPEVGELETRRFLDGLLFYGKSHKFKQTDV